jgi:hypothetical protein
MWIRDSCGPGGEAGYVIDVKTAASGCRPRSLTLRGQLDNARSGERLPSYRQFQQLARQGSHCPR